MLEIVKQFELHSIFGKWPIVAMFGNVKGDLVGISSHNTMYLHFGPFKMEAEDTKDIRLCMH